MRDAEYIFDLKYSGKTVCLYGETLKILGVSLRAPRACEAVVIGGELDGQLLIVDKGWVTFRSRQPKEELTDEQSPEQSS